MQKIQSANKLSLQLTSEIGRECSMHMEIRNAHKILVRKPEGKGPLRRPRHRWKDNIKMHLWTIELEGLDWIHPAQAGTCG
jgi:hypothetical protein